jgi:hypothetical protein
MKKPSATFVVFALLVIGALLGLYWTIRGGAEDGSEYVMYGAAGLALIVAILSRVLNGAWLTDSSGGH